MIDVETEQAGGAALGAGYLLVLLVLYRNPGAGIDVATGSLQPALYFLVIPVLGLIGGAYAYYEGPYGAVALFLFGSYLGLFGLTMTFGTLLAGGSAPLRLAAGFGVVVLAVGALMASLLQFGDFLMSGPSTKS